MFDAISPQMWNAVWEAFQQTMVMLGISGVATILLGLPLGVALFTFDTLGFTGRAVNAVLGALVNVTRSFPYAILMVSLIPLTRILVQTSIGPIAASVSLTIAAVPFFARLVETALRDIPSGKTDAAFAMGSARTQVIVKVWLPEALPTLIAAMTTTLVTIVGYSAMAGLIGGGGLGRLAYNYGYQRFIPEVMVITVVILIILVQAIQFIGDRLSRVVDHR